MKKIANLRVFPTILAGMIVGISFIIMTDLWLPITAVAAAFVVAVAGGIALYKKSRRAICISWKYISKTKRNKNSSRNKCWNW